MAGAAVTPLAKALPAPAPVILALDLASFDLALKEFYTAEAIRDCAYIVPLVLERGKWTLDPSRGKPETWPFHSESSDG